MYIKDNRNAKTVEFVSVKTGEVFFDVNGTGAFCMKIEAICTKDYDFINAIDLETGNTYSFCDDEKVEQVSASMSVN